MVMKTLACAAFAVLLGGGEVLAASRDAASGQCRFIQSRKDRNACYEHHSAAAAKRPATGSDNTKMIDAVEQMKLEDDRLAKRLQGICRGC